jgi:hypothetical protein
MCTDNSTQGLNIERVGSWSAPSGHTSNKFWPLYQPQVKDDRGIQDRSLRKLEAVQWFNYVPRSYSVEFPT